MRQDRATWQAKLIGLIAASMLAIAAAHAEPPPSPAAAPETVTIEAQKQRQLIEHQISTFVQSIVVTNRGEALLRWHYPVCPAIAGLTQAENEFVLTRLSQAVLDAGAPLGPENCTPNLLILATPEPEVLLKKWWARNPGLFNSDHGVGGIKRFMSGDRPIRAWYNAQLGCDDGAFKVRGGKTYIPSHCGGGLGSKLSWDVIRAIQSVIVIVDLRHITDLTVGQLTDYVTLIGLAQINENPDPGAAPSILQLFVAKGAERPEGSSSWDRSFLKGLYGTQVDNVVQVSQIKDRLNQDLLH